MAAVPLPCILPCQSKSRESQISGEQISGEQIRGEHKAVCRALLGTAKNAREVKSANTLLLWINHSKYMPEDFLPHAQQECMWSREGFLG